MLVSSASRMKCPPFLIWKCFELWKPCLKSGQLKAAQQIGSELFVLIYQLLRNETSFLEMYIDFHACFALNRWLKDVQSYFFFFFVDEVATLEA